MLITCDACLTRFHVPDEKIRAPSMRMRCAKCDHRFVVDTTALSDHSQRSPSRAGVPPPLPRSRGSSAEEGWEQIELPPSFEDLTKSATVAPTPPPVPYASSPTDHGTNTHTFNPAQAPTSPTPAPATKEPDESPSYPARAIEERMKYPSKNSSETDLDNVLASLPAIESTVPDLNPVAPEHLRIPQFHEDIPRKPIFARVIRVGISFALVAFLILISLPILSDGEVSFDSLSLRRWIASITSDSLVTKDVTSGLYKSRNGREFFYIYGSVMNRGKQPSRAQVQAEIIEDDKAMGTARAVVGAVPTPEEIYNLQAPTDLDQLLKSISSRTANIEPGASAPFLVIFTEHPSNLYTFKLRVSASRLDTPGT